MLQFCEVSGGPCRCNGADMKKAHDGMDITRGDFNALVEVLQDSDGRAGHPVPRAESAARAAGADAPRHHQHALKDAVMKQNLSRRRAARAAALGAQAGPLQMTVTDKDGKPAHDVVVLVDDAGPARPSNAPPVTATITQEGLKFQPFLTVVPVGQHAALRQPRRLRPPRALACPAARWAQRRRRRASSCASTPPTAARSSDDDYQNRTPRRARRAAPRSVDVKIDKAGPIGLGCHLHSLDARPGLRERHAVVRQDRRQRRRAASRACPTAPVELHAVAPRPVAGAAVACACRSSAAPLTLTGQLNFVPRRRRS